MDITQSPGLPAPETINAIVVYDARTGAIVHRHLAVRYPGAPAVDKSHLETRALELAGARGVSVRELRVLHVDPERFAEPVEHKVDVERQALVIARERPVTLEELNRRRA